MKMKLTTGPGDSILGFFVSHLANHDKVLNVGSGDGVLSQSLRDLGSEVHDIDIANYAADGLPQPKIYNGERIPYDANSFDVVLCVYVLHHAHKKQLDLLKELKRVSRDKIIIVEDTPKSILERPFLFQHALMSWFRGWGSWCTFRKDEEWRKIFSDQGLVVEETSVFYGRKIYPVTHTSYLLRLEN